MDWKGRHVLVTGGTGFSGSFMVEKLLSLGANVRVPTRSGSVGFLSHCSKKIEWMNGDLTDPQFCIQLVEGIDHIFHMASCRKNVAYHKEYCQQVIDENVKMAQGLIFAIGDRSDIHVSIFSTANIQQNCTLESLRQNGCTDGYILGKLQCEVMWQRLACCNDCNVLILRPVNFYGPRDRFSIDSNMIPALIVRASEEDNKLVVWGSGMQERSFLYVEDIPSATFTLIGAKTEGITYMYPEKTIPIRIVAEKIKNLVHPELLLDFDTSKPEGARTISLPDKHPALHSFLWTDLEQGLVQTIDWWRGNLSK